MKAKGIERNVHTYTVSAERGCGQWQAGTWRWAAQLLLPA